MATSKFLPSLVHFVRGFAAWAFLVFPLIAEFPYNANAYPGHSAGLADRHASFQHRPDGVVSACNRHSLKVCRRAASADGKN